MKLKLFFLIMIALIIAPNFVKAGFDRHDDCPAILQSDPPDACFLELFRSKYQTDPNKLTYAQLLAACIQGGDIDCFSFIMPFPYKDNPPCACQIIVKGWYQKSYPTLGICGNNINLSSIEIVDNNQQASQCTIHSQNYLTTNSNLFRYSLLQAINHLAGGINQYGELNEDAICAGAKSATEYGVYMASCWKIENVYYDDFEIAKLSNLPQLSQHKLTGANLGSGHGKISENDEILSLHLIGHRYSKCNTNGCCKQTVHVNFVEDTPFDNSQPAYNIRTSYKYWTSVDHLTGKETAMRTPYFDAGVLHKDSPSICLDDQGNTDANCVQICGRFEFDFNSVSLDDEQYYKNIENDLNPTNELTIKVSPNPSAGIFNVTGEDLSDGSYFIRVTDVTGKIVGEIALGKINGSFTKNINLSSQSSGVYRYSIIDELGKIVAYGLLNITK